MKARATACKTAMLLTALAGALPALAQTSDYPAEPIMYASFGPNDAQLFIADGDGRNVRPLLAEHGFDYNPSLSADGSWVTFTSERGGSPDIYRVHPDGAGIERLDRRSRV